MRSTETRANVPRRLFISKCLGIAIVPLLRAQDDRAIVPNRVGGRASQSRELKLIKEFKDAYLVAVSPDGGKMCLYFTKRPQTILTVGPGQIKYAGGAPKDEALAVIEVDSWRTLYAAQLRGKPARASFFAGGEVLYAETDNIFAENFQKYQQVVIDLAASKLEERVSPWRSVVYSALSESLLLGRDSNRKGGSGAELTLATLPDYTVTRRVPFAVTDEREPGSHDGDVFVSADRNTFACAAGHTIEYRRTGDLSVIWTRQIAPETVRGKVVLSDAGREQSRRCSHGYWLHR